MQVKLSIPEFVMLLVIVGIASFYFGTTLGQGKVVYNGDFHYHAEQVVPAAVMKGMAKGKR